MFQKLLGSARLVVGSFLILGMIFYPFQVSIDSLVKSISQASWRDEHVTVIDEDTIWSEGTTVEVKKIISIEDDATLTIGKGAKIKFEKEADDFLPGIELASGKIIAEGTESEPIRFTADDPESFYLSFFSNSQEQSFFRYVEFSNGGGYYDVFLVDNSWIKKQTVLASHDKAEYPLISYYGGKVHFENCTFKDNYLADIAINDDLDVLDSDYIEVTNSNFEGGWPEKAVVRGSACRYMTDFDEALVCYQRASFINNWYGYIFGPTYLDDDGNPPMDSFQKIGKAVAGDLYLFRSRAKELIADPLFVVPGITGSAQVFGEWKMDPILHTYDDLLEALERNGYEKGMNLFEFPYDWRKSNAVTAVDLKNRIAEVTAEFPVSKVDLAAHSMGGLVARQYIEGDDYDGKVDQLITMGTPHYGSPEAYLKWEAGEGFLSWVDAISKHHFKQEAKHEGYDSIYEYIQNEIPSVEQLLPIYDYLYDVEDDEMRTYPVQYPKNEFLEELNKSFRTERLQNVRFTNIVGNLENKNETIEKIRVVDSTESGLWEDGMPENFYDDETDQGLEFGKGDKTVPVYSSETIASNKMIELDHKHSDLPSKSQCYVFKELTGQTDCNYDEDMNIPNLLLFNVFSPVDIQIIDPDNLKIGKNFSDGGWFNEIEDAYYSGFDTPNEMIAIPNPKNGKYVIKTKATGEGTYKIEAVSIGEDEEGSITEKSMTFEGLAEGDNENEEEIECSDGEIKTEEADLEAPLIEIYNPQDGSNLLNDQILEIGYNISDNVSQENDIKADVYLDDQRQNSSEVDLTLLNLGGHSVSITAEDEAGNTASETAGFEVTTSLNAIQNNIEHYNDLGYFHNEQTLKILRTWLGKIEKIDKNIEKARSKNKRNKIIKILEKIRSKRVEQLIHLIEKNGAIKIDEKVKDSLVEQLTFIK